MRLGSILGIAFATIIIVFLTSLILVKRIRSAKEKMDPDQTKIKCRASNCELLVNRMKSKDYLCEFHKTIQHYHFILEENKDPLRMKSRMYMESNAAVYKSIQSFENVIKDLERATKKYKD